MGQMGWNGTTTKESVKFSESWLMIKQTPFNEDIRQKGNNLWTEGPLRAQLTVILLNKLMKMPVYYFWKKKPGMEINIFWFVCKLIFGTKIRPTPSTIKNL